jgi:GntR family transcriptional regulator
MILETGPTPLYYQLKSILEGKIRSQEFEEKECLPSEAGLCQQFNVSRTTVRQALSELLRDGLIYRERGRGTFVAEGAGWKRPVLKGSIEDLMAAGEGTWIKVLSYEEVPVPREFLEPMKMGKSERVHRLEIVRLMSIGPQGYSLIYFPPNPGRMISRDDIKEDTEIISFAEDKMGAKVHGAHQTIDIGVADEFLAKNLSVKPQTPLFIILRQYYTRKGALVFLAKSYFRPDRFKYEIELTRT